MIVVLDANAGIEIVLNRSKAGFLSKEKGITLLSLDEYYDISENNTESLIESVRLNRSSYDMLYFTLA